MSVITDPIAEGARCMIYHELLLKISDNSPHSETCVIYYDCQTPNKTKTLALDLFEGYASSLPHI
jgi:hypothetical protein